MGDSPISRESVKTVVAMVRMYYEELLAAGFDKGQAERLVGFWWQALIMKPSEKQEPITVGEPFPYGKPS